jgi:hypothetical protein
MMCPLCGCPAEHDGAGVRCQCRNKRCKFSVTQETWDMMQRFAEASRSKRFIVLKRSSIDLNVSTMAGFLFQRCADPVKP